MNSKKVKVLEITILIVLLSGCTFGRKFNGSSTGNEDQFIVTYTILNIEEKSALVLQKGDRVNCVIANDSGKLTVRILNEDDEELEKKEYKKDTDNFIFKAPENGKYTVAVSGKKAKGSVSFTK